MGAWGPAIFSDDTACDIRSEYRELLEDGVDDAEATSRVIAAYHHLGDDEAHVLWLALAATQASLGRLDGSVKSRALQVIDNNLGLELWVEAGPHELALRKAALAKLRKTLTGPQKVPTKVRRPWSHVTDLKPGDVLAYRRPTGQYALLRVARIDEQRVGTAPILRQLNWNKAAIPSERKIRRLRTLPETHPMSEEPSVSFRVARHRKKDLDWSDAGFSLVAHVDPSRDDTAFRQRSYLDWRALSHNLENGW